MKVGSEGLEVLSGLVAFHVPTLLEPKWPSPFLSERLSKHQHFPSRNMVSQNTVLLIAGNTYCSEISS